MAGNITGLSAAFVSGHITYDGAGASLGLASATVAPADLLDASAGDCERSMTLLGSSSESDDRGDREVLTGVLNGSLAATAADLESNLMRDWRRSLIFRRIFCWSDSLCRDFAVAAAVFQISARLVRTLVQYVAAPEGLRRKGL